jgi:hypothetical protein
MECLGYMLLYLARGSLPWQGVKNSDKKLKYDLILQKKLKHSIESLSADTEMEP